MIVLIFFIIIILFLFYLLRYYFSVKRKKFQNELRCFMEENEGLELFVYTNRKIVCDVIETQLLPKLDRSINVVKMEGRNPNTELDKVFISYALYRLKNVGFPNLMKIVNGEFIDISLHKEIYNAINNKNYDEAYAVIEKGLLRLRKFDE